MQLVMPFTRTISYAPLDFIRGGANSRALDIVQRWPDWPDAIIYIHGSMACGKTHLAHVFAAQSGAVFIDPALIGTRTADQLLVGSHAWIIDDLEAVGDEAALVQLINHVRARGDYLLLTARTSPALYACVLPDLRSRLRALPACALGEPDDELLMGVLAKQFADRQLRISRGLLRYAVQQVERSYESIQYLVRAMDSLSLVQGRAMTVSLVREALKNTQRPTP